MPATKSPAAILRIFIGENDKHHGRPLFEALVELAQQHQLAGATVLRGTLGYGVQKQIHTAKVLHLSEDLPMVIEIVDQSERIEAFLPALEPLVGNGLVTVEQIQVIAFAAQPS